jgi:uncharacterized membrane protein HdeD (DUF308 family)
MVLIKGIIMILLSILIFQSPAQAILSFILYIGIGFIIAGIVRIIQGFQANGKHTNWTWIVLEGFIDILFGIVLSAHPELTAATLPFVFGFWAGFYGLYLMVDAFSGPDNRGMKFFVGVFTIILGYVIIFNPLFVGLSLTFWLGILLLFVGIYNVIVSFSIK